MSMYFYNIFKNKKLVFPVIHVLDVNQTIENAEIAFSEDADGIFLINHDYNYAHLLGIFAKVREKFPDKWIGINFLDIYPHDIFNFITNEVNGVWVDNAGIDENKERQDYAETVQKKIKQKKWQGLYFGGVAFKYQREVEELEKAASIASKYMDVITTSGPATGLAAEIEKIKRIRKGAGLHPIAIASGITPENVVDYLPFANAFLVATGIGKDFYHLDPQKVKKLVDVVRNYDL